MARAAFALSYRAASVAPSGRFEAGGVIPRPVPLSSVMLGIVPEDEHVANSDCFPSLSTGWRRLRLTDTPYVCPRNRRRQPLYPPRSPCPAACRDLKSVCQRTADDHPFHPPASVFGRSRNGPFDSWQWIPFADPCVYHVRIGVSPARCSGCFLPSVGPQPREDRRGAGCLLCVRWPWKKYLAASLRAS